MKASVTSNQGTPVKSSESDLCRAAGSKSLDRLKEALPQWSCEEIDAANTFKSPLHMAAWKGSLENLKYLVEEIGCDINVVSKGQYSYGKTPIFFALTQSRSDVVAYLLERGCNVKIVNNKGQTPLSIGSSRLSTPLVEKIQELEQTQHDIPWQNYRETHSDGFEYGDLDVRFVATIRPSDSVTKYAVNPTTPQIRRGIFARLNPQGQKQKVQHRVAQPKPKDAKPVLLSWESNVELQNAWEQLEQGNSSTAAAALRSIVRISNKKRCAWIPDAVQRLRGFQTQHIIEEWIQLAKQSAPTEEKKLLSRLERHWRDPEAYRNTPARKETKPKDNTIDHKLWKRAFEHVRHLSIQSLCIGDTYLSLLRSPKWIDAKDSLEELQKQIRDEKFLCFDSEWCEDGNISTLQLATADSVWVVDCCPADVEYRNALKHLVQSVWKDGEKLFMGFSATHDMVKIKELAGVSAMAPDCEILDLQRLWIHEGNAGSIPGLAACVKTVSSRCLDKSCQCSDWEARPLAPEQLEYAGLDAAVLAYLLAEHWKHKEVILS